MGYIFNELWDILGVIDYELYFFVNYGIYFLMNYGIFLGKLWAIFLVNYGIYFSVNYGIYFILKCQMLIHNWFPNKFVPVKLLLRVCTHTNWFKSFQISSKSFNDPSLLLRNKIDTLKTAEIKIEIKLMITVNVAV